MTPRLLCLLSMMAMAQALACSSDDSPAAPGTGTQSDAAAADQGAADQGAGDTAPIDSPVTIKVTYGATTETFYCATAEKLVLQTMFVEQGSSNPGPSWGVFCKPGSNPQPSDKKLYFGFTSKKSADRTEAGTHAVGGNDSVSENNDVLTVGIEQSCEGFSYAPSVDTPWTGSLKLDNAAAKSGKVSGSLEASWTASQKYDAGCNKIAGGPAGSVLVTFKDLSLDL